MKRKVIFRFQVSFLALVLLISFCCSCSAHNAIIRETDADSFTAEFLNPVIAEYESCNSEPEFRKAFVIYGPESLSEVFAANPFTGIDFESETLVVFIFGSVSSATIELRKASPARDGFQIDLKYQKHLTLYPSGDATAPHLRYVVIRINQKISGGINVYI